MSFPFLSVGLCTYNRADFLPRVLETLRQQTLDPALFEILVIDNNSTDDTREVVQQFADSNPQLNMRYCLETNQGVSYARNRSYQEAQGEYVVYFDDDELAEPDWLAGYHRFISRNPGAAIYAGRIVIAYLDGAPDWNSEYVEGWYGKYDFGAQAIEITEDAVAARRVALPNAGNMAARVDFLKVCGGFDITLGRKGNQMLGGEETQIALKAFEQGERMVYNPSSTIAHVVFPARLSIDFLKEKHFMQGRTYFRLHKEEIVRKGLLRLLAGKTAYCLRLLSGMITPSRQRQLEACLRLTFEQGILSCVFKEGCRA